ncbi:MAG: ORF6N domain-containing protein [Nitrospirae bacterium]|nr:ORF6N domain-containing protein [Nitrospirota bacterium]
MNEIIPQELIERKIYVIRGQKVMLDRDLANLYGVETRTLNQAVKRNIKRFPNDFMFQLTKEEFSVQRSQIVLFEKGKGRYPKYLPCMFTEQGIAMLSSVLNSARAILVNIEIMRAFVRLRKMLASNAYLARKIKALEKKYDGQFAAVFDAIYNLMNPPEKKRPKIGFKREGGIE